MRDFTQGISRLLGLSLALMLVGCSPEEKEAPRVAHNEGIHMHYEKMSDINSGYHSTDVDWHRFLACWQQAVAKRLANHADKYLRLNGPSHLASPGDAAYARNGAQLNALEKQLGLKLPKSYRDFALITGGYWWLDSTDMEAAPGLSSHFVSITSVGKFKDVDPVNWGDLQAVYSHVAAIRIPPAVYYRYGYSEAADQLQDSAQVNGLDTGDMLKVGELENPGTILLINPKQITSDGEWEVWIWSPQLPGAARYRSFAEMMQVLAYQDILNEGGLFLPAEKLRTTCARYIETAATN